MLLTIDGSQGEGGGQILRTSLALSIITGKPFRLFNLRAGRRRPGLLHQHRTAVEAAAELCNATVEGAVLHSRDLTFSPGPVQPGSYRFDIGTAGSATLVLQTILPALLTAPAPSHLSLRGGTHNPAAPPFDALEKTFLPALNRMGPNVSLTLGRPGFHPVGAGELEAHIQPAPRLSPLDLLDRGPIRSVRGRALLAGGLPDSIGERELRILEERLRIPRTHLAVERLRTSLGPGNAVMVEVESQALTEVFTAFGRKGLLAERVADDAARQTCDYLAAEVPVGIHTADQLLLPIALAGRGVFRTVPPSLHTRTNIDVIRQFLDIPIHATEERPGTWNITVG